MLIISLTLLLASKEMLGAGVPDVLARLTADVVMDQMALLEGGKATGKRAVRIAAQAYNYRGQYVALADALKHRPRGL